MPHRAHGPLQNGLCILLAICAAMMGCQTAHPGGGRGAPHFATHSPNRFVARTGPKSGSSQPGADAAPAVAVLRPVPLGDASGGSVATVGMKAGAKRVGSRIGTETPVGHSQPEPPLIGNQLPPPIPTEGSGRLVPVPTGEGQAVEVVPLPGTSSHPYPAPTPLKGAGPVVAGPVGYGHAKHGKGAPIVPIPNAPREFAKQSLPSYVIEPPDLLLIQGSAAISSPVLPLAGTHLVRQDGTIGLGIYGDVYVAGMTLRDAKVAVASALKTWLDRPFNQGSAAALGIGPTVPYLLKLTDKQPLALDQILQELQVDVAAYNSKFYYIILEGGGYGEQVFRVPVTGNETVLDALAQVNGLPAVASSKKIIWLARATPGAYAKPMVLPVDWKSITRAGTGATNYQIFPNDRLFVKSDQRFILDAEINKTLSPIDRIFSSILLGASAVNQIRTDPNRSGNTFP